jgi:transcriptional regulator with XRE-family HTH domain
MSTNLAAAREVIKNKPYAINVSALARCSGTTDSHVSRILNPKHPHMPSLKLATRMAKCLDVSLQELLDFLDSLEKPEWPVLDSSSS